MTTETFDTLLLEVERGESTLLASSRTGQDGVLRIIVQRAHGGISSAFDYYSEPAREAYHWSIPQLEFVYQHVETMFGLDCPLDGERLFQFVSFAKAADAAALEVQLKIRERAITEAAVEEAARLMGVSR